MSLTTGLFAGCCFVLMLALGQLFVRKKTPANIILFALMVICSVWLTHGTWYALDIVEGYYYHANKTHVPFLALCGPMWYLYNRCLFENYQLESKTLRHALPGALCLFLSIPFYMGSVDFKANYVEADLYNLATISIYIATRIAEVTLITYLVLTFIYLRDIRRRSNVKIDAKAVNLLTSITAVAVPTGVMRLVGAVLGEKTFSVVIPCSITFTAFAILYCFSHQYPNLLSLGLTSPKNKKDHVSESDVLESYRHKIERERWYLDPDIKIQQLADLLDIQSHRLSEVINNAAGTNFNGFINSFRIEHAKQLLIQNPDLSILDIAYESGFNSRSAFYKHFTLLTATTPSDFRKNGIGATLTAA